MFVREGDDGGLARFAEPEGDEYDERAASWAIDHGKVMGVSVARRLRVEALGHGFWQAELRFGFMEKPNVPEALALGAVQGLDIDLFGTSFFVSRETVVPRASAAMARWRQRLFEAMSRNAARSVDFFGIPPNAVIELGTRVQL